MKIKLDINGFIKNKGLIKKILTVPKYILLFGSMLASFNVSQKVKLPKTELPTSVEIDESIASSEAKDFYVSSSHTGQFGSKYYAENDNEKNDNKFKDFITRLYFNITKKINSDVKYTRFDIPENYGPIKVYVDKDFSDKQIESLQKVIDEYNLLFSTRNANYKFEINKGITTSSHLNPYDIIVYEMGDNYRSNVKFLNLNKTDVVQIGFARVFMQNLEENLLESTFRHEMGHVLGLGDAYLYKNTDYFIDGLMGYNNDFDENTVKLINGLYSIQTEENNNSNDLIQEFLENTGTYKELKESTDKYLSKLSKAELSELNFDLSSVDGKVYEANLIFNQNTFNYHSKSMMCITIKDNKVFEYYYNYGVDGKTSVFSTEDEYSDIIIPADKRIDGKIYYQDYLLALKDNNIVMIDTETGKIYYELKVIENELYDDYVAKLEEKNKTLDYLDSIRTDGYTYIQARVMDYFQSDAVFDQLMKEIELSCAGYVNSKLGTKIEFDFDINGAYQMSNGNFDFIDGNKHTVYFDNANYKKLDYSLVENTKFLNSSCVMIKCGDFYILCDFSYDILTDDITFKGIYSIGEKLDMTSEQFQKHINELIIERESKSTATSTME